MLLFLHFYNNVIIPFLQTYFNKLTFENASVTENVVELTIGDSAFAGCTSIETFTLPSGMEILEEAVFVGCTGLIKVVIPKGVTEIMTSAFMGCSSLTEITFTTDLLEIGDSAFEGCTALSSIYYDGSMDQINAVLIGEGNDPLYSAEVYTDVQTPVDDPEENYWAMVKEAEDQLLNHPCTMDATIKVSASDGTSNLLETELDVYYILRDGDMYVEGEVMDENGDIIQSTQTIIDGIVYDFDGYERRKTNGTPAQIYALIAENLEVMVIGPEDFQYAEINTVGDTLILTFTQPTEEGLLILMNEMGLEQCDTLSYTVYLKNGMIDGYGFHMSEMQEGFEMTMDVIISVRYDQVPAVSFPSDGSTYTWVPFEELFPELTVDENVDIPVEPMGSTAPETDVPEDPPAEPMGSTAETVEPDEPDEEEWGSTVETDRPAL